MRRLLLVTVLLLSAACYEYREPLTAVPAPGVRVSAELSDSGSMVLAKSVGPGVAAVEGQLLRVTDKEVELAVTGVRQHDGMQAPWRGERLTVSRDLLRDLHVRRLSRSRTTFLAGAAVVGAVIVRQAFRGSGGGSPPVVGTGPTGPR
jgi:hypothetical protein